MLVCWEKRTRYIWGIFNAKPQTSVIYKIAKGYLEHCSLYLCVVPWHPAQYLHGRLWSVSSACLELLWWLSQQGHSHSILVKVDTVALVSQSDAKCHKFCDLTRSFLRHVQQKGLVRKACTFPCCIKWYVAKGVLCPTTCHPPPPRPKFYSRRVTFQS